MSLFDSLINEVSERFGIGNKAETLLSTLLAFITNNQTGGISGFLNMFSQAGLGDLANSWVSTGSNSAISNEQLESAMGKSSIQQIAEKVGLPAATATSALAFMLPKIIDKLTPNGEVPANESILSTIGSYLTGAGATVAGAGATVAGAVGAGANSARETVNNATNYVSNTVDDNSGGNILKWLLPLLLLGLLLFLGYTFCGGKKDAPVVTNTNANANKANTNANVAVKAVDGSVKIEAKDGKYTVTGAVPDEAAKKQIVDAMTAQYGAGNVNFDGLKVVEGAKLGTGWWEGFNKLLPNLKDWKTGVLAFTGAAITEATGLPKAALDAIKSLFGTGWKLPLSVIGEAGAAKTANEDAEKQLAAAKSTEDVVKALNASIINFASGKSDVPADDKKILDEAGKVLKTQPADTVIEIGGYTDNKGKSDANIKLSQARADSVRKALIADGVSEKMLTAKGYGDANPVGDNSTPEGQFKNRRIEYKVVTVIFSTSMTTTETKTTNTNTKPMEANKQVTNMANKPATANK